MEADWYLEKIKAAGLKLTKPRLAVLDILSSRSTDFISADNIHQTILDKGQGVDLTSIYRTLTSLEEISVVEKSDFFGEASRYRLVTHHDDHDHHHHYFKCNECGMVEVLCGDCNIHHYETGLGKRGFTNLNHRLEFNGLCPSCSK